MTSLMGARKRAEEFDALVEGRTAESDPHPELDELLGVVGVLRTQGAPVLRDDFSVALREQLMAEAATSLGKNSVLALPPRRHGVRERRLALLASSFVLIGGSAGMAVAAQDALPGDALYPIKRGLEKANTDLSTSDSRKGRVLLARADNRLSEADGLMGDPTGRTQVGATLDDFTAHAIEGSDLLLDSYAASGDEADVRDVRSFAAENIGLLQQLAKIAPAEFQDELAVAATALMEIDDQASAACQSCAADLPSLKMPDLLMVVSEVNRARDAVDGAEMNNDHPLLRDRPQDKGTGGGAGAKDKSEQPGPDEPAPDGSEGSGLAEVPGGKVDVEAPKGGKDLVEEIDKGTGGKVGKVGDDVKKVLPDELDPILDTLLP